MTRLHRRALMARNRYNSSRANAFPRVQLQSDLDERGLSMYAVKKLTGVPIWMALKRGQVLRPTSLLRVIRKLGLDQERYADYIRLAAPRRDTTVDAACGECGFRRPIKWRSLLDVIRRRRADREPPPKQLDDGAYLITCSACVGRRALKAENEAKWAGLESAQRRRKVLKQVGPHSWSNFRTNARKPLRASHREAISRARTHMARVTGLYLCALCGLVVHSLEKKKPRHWHRTCWNTWHGWQMRRGAAAIAPRRGRPADTNLDRNYRILMLTRGGGLTRTKLIGHSDVVIQPYARRGRGLARHGGDVLHDRSTITKACEALIRLLPGSWDLVFSPGGYKIPAGVDRSHIGRAARSKAGPATSRRRAAQTARERRESRRQANAERQRLVPLPDEFRTIVESGTRDALIARLHQIGMPEYEIVALIGDPTGERVKSVITAFREGKAGA